MTRDVIGEDLASDVTNPRLTQDDIDALARLGSRRRLRDGESLFQSGERAGGFHIVLSGRIEITDRSDDEGRVIGAHEAGQFTGDIDILTRRLPVVSAVARGETEVLGVRSSHVRRIIADRPRLGETILRAFMARREDLLDSGSGALRVIGTAASRESFRLREFLSRNQVPFTWIDVADEMHVTALGSFGIGAHDLPVVAADGQPLMRNPSIGTVADALGLRRRVRTAMYDLVIVGAGPAGLAAAVYGGSEGLSTLILDAFAPGGQAGTSSRIENYLGFPTGISGADLTARATLQAHKFGIELSSPAEVTGLDVDGEHPVVRLDSGERAVTRCVLIATGVDYRRLDVPGRERFDGVGVYYAATPMEVSACAGNDAVVVGGGNSAGQAAMFLAENTRRVWVVLRGGDLRKSMSSYLVDRLEAAANVDVLLHTEIREVLGAERMQGVRVENTRTGETRVIETGALFSFIGAVPRTAWLPPQIETDPNGFIRTGPGVRNAGAWPLQRDPYLLESSRPGIFAAGDVRAGAVTRVASAVGEGAMAVKFVHAYLAEMS